MAHAEAETQETSYVNAPQKCDASQEKNHSKTHSIKGGYNRHVNEFIRVTKTNDYVNVQSQQATEKGKLFKYFRL